LRLDVAGFRKLRRCELRCDEFGRDGFRLTDLGNCNVRHDDCGLGNIRLCGFRRGRFKSRRWRYGNSSLFDGPEALAAVFEFGVVEMPAATGFKLRDPALEYVGGKVEHFQQGRRRRAGLVQPGVECLFHGPAGFAQVGQSDHAAAALQRMVTAPDRDQCFVVAGVGVQQRELLADGGQDFVGFLEENSEQFRVEVFLAGIHESRCFRRGRRRLDGGRRRRWGNFGRRGDAFHFEFRQGVRRRSYGVRHRQRCRFRVRRAVQRQFGQRFPGRRRHRCRRDFRFHGNGRFRDFRFRRSRLGDHWRRKYGVDVGRATLQLGDEETQCRELLRDVLELARLRRKTGLREALDSRRAFGEHGIGAILNEHQQGALNLAYRLLQSAQGGLARWIAEVGV
jgi:hypothetical protein